MSAHRVHRSLPYPRERLFDLAADVERYPQFLPWWAAARIQKRDGNVYYTDQVVRFAMLRQRFASRTELHRPERIEVSAADGPVRKLALTWQFEALPEEGCQVSLAVELDLRSRVLQSVFSQAMLDTIEPIMSAFEARAHSLFNPAPGPASATVRSASHDRGL